MVATMPPESFGYPDGYDGTPPAAAPAEEPPWAEGDRPWWESEEYG